MKYWLVFLFATSNGLIEWSDDTQTEILTLQADTEFKSRAHGQFWNLLTEEKNPNIKKCATSLTALFGSTYWCESAFSHMKIIKSKYCSIMTDDHLEGCLRLVTSSYFPDYASLADFIQCKSSEWGNNRKCTELYCAIWVHTVMQGTPTYLLPTYTVHIKHFQYIYM